MQKSKHKLESKQKLICQNNKQTIDTNYETIETDYDQEFNSMKNVHCHDIEMAPQGQILLNEEEYKTKRQNDSVHLEIELDDGKIQIIKPNINDNPYLLAKKFCTNNQLDQQMIPILASNIQKTIQKLIKTTTNKDINLNQNKNLKNNKTKSNCINTEHSIINERHNTPTNFMNKKRSSSKHFQEISKQFSKKKIQPQNPMNDFKSPPSFNVNNNYKSINPNSNDKNLKHKSNKKQPQYHSIKTQKSLKTEPNQPLKNRASPFISINKENHIQSTFFDYLPQNSRKQNIKNKQKIQGFMKRNCGFQSVNKSSISQKKIVNKSFQKRQNSRQSGSKESFKKTFTRSIESSVDSQDRHTSFNKNQRSPFVNHSLMNLSANSGRGRIGNHNKQPSNFLLENSTSSSQHILKTHRLYENQKQKTFKSIFSLLDDDGDGVISIVNINLVNKIQQRLIQVLFPVLEEMEILQTELNEQEFVQAMEKLFVKLTVEQKGYLLKYYNRQQQQENKKCYNTSQNQPKMSPISLQLVNQTQRRNVTVYQYSKLREQQKNKKIQKQRIQKQKVMMRNCTFHPKVNSRKIIYF